MRHLGLLVSAMALLSCQNEERWYPSAEAERFRGYEYAPADGGGTFHVTTVVHNTGGGDPGTSGEQTRLSETAAKAQHAGIQADGSRIPASFLCVR
ncbi:MAG: hypothetical protein LBD58_04450 [Treponema sp.]|nr:hypothetical protein [Treponema sp.]